MFLQNRIIWKGNNEIGNYEACKTELRNLKKKFMNLKNPGQS